MARSGLGRGSYLHLATCNGSSSLKSYNSVIGGSDPCEVRDGFVLVQTRLLGNDDCILRCLGCSCGLVFRDYDVCFRLATSTLISGASIFINVVNAGACCSDTSRNPVATFRPPTIIALMAGNMRELYG